MINDGRAIAGLATACAALAVLFSCALDWPEPLEEGENKTGLLDLRILLRPTEADFGEGVLCRLVFCLLTISIGLSSGQWSPTSYGAGCI